MLSSSNFNNVNGYSLSHLPGASFLLSPPLPSAAHHQLAVMPISRNNGFALPKPPDLFPQPWKKSSSGEKKDRHSKIRTAQGLRDRRVRLSIRIARKFFDLQDILGFDKASETLDWLLGKSETAILELEKMKNHQYYTSLSSASATKFQVDRGVPRGRNPVKVSLNREKKQRREMARARARERTKEKRKLPDLDPITCQDDDHDQLGSKNLGEFDHGRDHDGIDIGPIQSCPKLVHQHEGSSMIRKKYLNSCFINLNDQNQMSISNNVRSPSNPLISWDFWNSNFHAEAFFI